MPEAIELGAGDVPLQRIVVSQPHSTTADHSTDDSTLTGDDVLPCRVFVELRCCNETKQSTRLPGMTT